MYFCIYLFENKLKYTILMGLLSIQNCFVVVVDVDESRTIIFGFNVTYTIQLRFVFLLCSFILFVNSKCVTNSIRLDSCFFLLGFSLHFFIYTQLFQLEYCLENILMCEYLSLCSKIPLATIAIKISSNERTQNSQKKKRRRTMKLSMGTLNIFKEHYIKNPTALSFIFLYQRQFLFQLNKLYVSVCMFLLLLFFRRYIISAVRVFMLMLLQDSEIMLERNAQYSSSQSICSI